MSNINDEEFDNKINKIVSSLLDKSFKSSIKYVAHSKRINMTTQDWIYSFKCLSLLFIKSIINDDDFIINYNKLIEVKEYDDKIEIPHFTNKEENEEDKEDKEEEEDEDKEEEDEDNEDQDEDDQYEEDQDEKDQDNQEEDEEDQDNQEEDEEDQDKVNQEEDNNKLFHESLCKCEECVKINNHNKLWKSYEPINMIQEVIKKSVDEIIINKFSKYL